MSTPTITELVDESMRAPTEQEIADAREQLGPDWQRIEGLLTKVGAVERSRESGTRRFFRLVEIATEFSEIVAPHVACRGRGCSHCCKMAVNLTEREAIRIGTFLKRAPARLPVEHDPLKIAEKLGAEIEQYTGKPCPMLATDGACTIYPVRPLACILQHSLENDPEPCNLETGRHWVKKLNTMAISIPLVAMDITRPIGDIREFFP